MLAEGFFLWVPLSFTVRHSRLSKPVARLQVSLLSLLEQVLSVAWSIFLVTYLGLNPS